MEGTLTETLEQRAVRFLTDLGKGLTYSEVGSIHGISGDAVRGVVRRFNAKTSGTYTGYVKAPPLPQNLLEFVEPKVIDESPVSIPEDLPAFEPLEIWNIDIERFPRVVFEWSAKHGKFTPEIMVIQESRMISFAAKQLNGPVIFSSEFHHGREKMLETLWHILNRATIVVGFNSRRFDVPHMDGELKDAGFPVYKPFKQIDLMQTVKSRFRYDHNGLKSVAVRWGLEEKKMDNEGFELWRRCFNNDPEAWEIMKQYNMQDVRTCESAYLDVLPWLTGSIPNLGLWINSSDGMVCPACGSSHVTEDGTASTGVSLFTAYRCDDCGYRSRSNNKVSSTTLRPITR